MKAKELRELSVKDLNEKLLELRSEAFNLRVRKATGQLSQTHLMGAIKKDIARIKMVLAEKAEV